ncbi:MAG: hypothetical protein ACHREM_04610 [Polyangiales bacterium]
MSNEKKHDDKDEERKRVLVVYDGTAWFARHLQSITHDLERNEKVYRCDEPLGGPFESIEGAFGILREHGHRNQRETLLKDEQASLADLFSRIGTWSGVPWDQHIRNEMGDGHADAIVRWLLQQGIHPDQGSDVHNGGVVMTTRDVMRDALDAALAKVSALEKELAAARAELKQRGAPCTTSA